jgi:hypothetical protein
MSMYGPRTVQGVWNPGNHVGVLQNHRIKRSRRECDGHFPRPPTRGAIGPGFGFWGPRLRFAEGYRRNRRNPSSNGSGRIPNTVSIALDGVLVPSTNMRS